MKSKRRNFLQTLGQAAITLGVTSTFASTPMAASAKTKKPDHHDNPKEDGQVLFIGDHIALVETTNGKVRGFIIRDMYTFLGIPYGAPTSGKNRFMPPQKPEPWTDVYPAVYWGNAAPQILDNFYSNRYLAFTDDWHYDEISEDCLHINVWTPNPKDGKKRPVLFWIHGGGFSSGNAIEHPEYHGENLARFGDVVFCSVNHRLGPLGFANFAGVGGKEYAASGNVGMLDIVAALEWVRDNISVFGGDPNNVTIMGQSGGGAKVTILTAMPSAKGLFHKAVALSGSSMKAAEKVDSEKLGAYVLKEAGLTESQTGRLQELPWKEYYKIATAANKKFRDDMGITTVFGGGFSPVKDGIYLPQHPYFPEPTPLAVNIPMIICTTVYERSPSAFDSSLENITMEKAPELLKQTRGFGQPIGDKAGKVIEAYAKAFPDRKPIEIVSMALSTRKAAVDLADAKSKQPAPVYVAWFGWNPPLFDNRLRSFHTLDIGFWFYNTDRQLSHSGGGSRPRKLAEKMASTLVQFMKTGDVNGAGFPNWSYYTKENGAVMVINDVSELQNDPDKEARKSLL
jgi:para-nitrobenzyl esterase